LHGGQTHAQSLIDLHDRFEVPTHSVRAKRGDGVRGEFPFRSGDNLDKILADSSVDCVASSRRRARIRPGAPRRRSGKHILLEKPLEVSTARGAAW